MNLRHLLEFLCIKTQRLLLLFSYIQAPPILPFTTFCSTSAIIMQETTSTFISQSNQEHGTPSQGPRYKSKVPCSLRVFTDVMPQPLSPPLSSPALEQQAATINQEECLFYLDEMTAYLLDVHVESIPSPELGRMHEWLTEFSQVLYEIRVLRAVEHNSHDPGYDVDSLVTGFDDILHSIWGRLIEQQYALLYRINRPISWYPPSPTAVGPSLATVECHGNTCLGWDDRLLC